MRTIFLISDLNIITNDIPFARFLNVPIEQSIFVFEYISYQMMGPWYLIDILLSFIRHVGIWKWSDCLVSYLWISRLCTNIGNISDNLEQFSLYIKRAILYLYKLLTFKILSSENNGSVWVLGGTLWIIRTIFFCNMTNLLKWLWYVEPHTCIQHVK